MDVLNSVQKAAQRVLEGKIDFVAQQQAELATYIVLSVSTLVSFLAGYLLADLRVSLAVFGSSVLLLVLAFVPPWPYLNRHPVPWRSPVPGPKSE